MLELFGVSYKVSKWLFVDVMLSPKKHLIR